ncbi:MAG: hypothetical protein R6T98_09350 [Desulfatiglandales bacterium]
MEGCRLFVTYQWGNPQAPIYRGNAEGFRLDSVLEGTPPRKGEPEALRIAPIYRGLRVPPLIRYEKTAPSHQSLQNSPSSFWGW